MLVEDCQSSGPIVHDPPTVAQSRVCRQRYDVYIEVLRHLQESNHEEVAKPGFEEELLAHFNRLPARYFLPLPSSTLHLAAAESCVMIIRGLREYALNVNVERAGPAVEICSCLVSEIAAFLKLSAKR